MTQEVAGNPVQQAVRPVDAINAGTPSLAGYEALNDQLRESERHVENLEVALVSSRVIGAAIGIIMAMQKLTYDGAFAEISRVSQIRNLKLRMIAEQIVETGTFE